MRVLLIFFKEIKMTLSKAIKGFRDLCPNPYPSEQLIAWISELDGLALADIFSSRADCPEGWQAYTQTDMDKELLIPPPYDGIYFDWLKSKVDYWQDESNYSNSSKAFNNAYMSFGDYWRRTHGPLQKRQWKLLGGI